MNFFRIEFLTIDKEKVGAGMVTGNIMNKYNLEATPYIDFGNKKIEHWFTKKGWEQVGKKIIEDFTNHHNKRYYNSSYEDYDVVDYKLRSRKTKPRKVQWKDDLQIMCVF